MPFDLTEYAASCHVADPDRFCSMCRQFRDLLITTNRTMNLTRITEPEEFAIKHVADSLAIARFFPEFATEKLRVADIGCGAGIPSLILAMAFPQLRLVAIDSTGKKTAFVAKAVETLDLDNVEVIHGRSCELDRKPEFRHRFDVVTARAVAPAPIIYGDASHFIRRGGRFILYKTPEQAGEDLPALKRLTQREPIEWFRTESFELPLAAGRRLFLYSEFANPAPGR